MRKSNLLKTVVCAVMCSLMIGTTALAATKTTDIRVRGQKNYTEILDGAYGYFTATSNGTYARTTVINQSNATRLYNCSVNRYNYNKCKYDMPLDASMILENGEITEAKIERDKNSYVYDYFHYAVSYSSTTSSSYSRVDYFTVNALQYYR